MRRLLVADTVSTGSGGPHDETADADKTKQGFAVEPCVRFSRNNRPHSDELRRKTNAQALIPLLAMSHASVAMAIAPDPESLDEAVGGELVMRGEQTKRHRRPFWRRAACALRKSTVLARPGSQQRWRSTAHLQYGLQQLHAKELGWREVMMIDEDLGRIGRWRRRMRPGIPETR